MWKGANSYMYMIQMQLDFDPYCVIPMMSLDDLRD